MTPVSITAIRVLAKPVVDCSHAVVAEIAEGVVDELGSRYHWPCQLPKFRSGLLALLGSVLARKCGSFGRPV